MQNNYAVVQQNDDSRYIGKSTLGDTSFTGEQVNMLFLFSDGTMLGLRICRH